VNFFLAIAVVVGRKPRRREREIEERGQRAKRAQLTDSKKIAISQAKGGTVNLSRERAAPPWRHHRSFEKATESRGRLFWAARQTTPRSLTLD
jgi:xanthine/CO dehydrogenase XdhC/CoxF family maturation factor